MRQLVLTAGTLCAAAVLAHWASAQNQVMPGQVVGTTLNANPVGTRFPEAALQLGVWAAEGKIQNRVHIVDGFLSAPTAINMLFTGENLGKLVVKV